MTLTVRVDRALVAAAVFSRRFAMATVKAPDLPPKAGRSPVNVAMVLDRSGSMGGQKIRLAREAVLRAIRMLHPTDRVSLVAYDSEVLLLVESTFAVREAVDNAVQRLGEVDARGTTDLAAGWMRGCEQVALHLEPSQVSRCLLLTDGLANHGITDHSVLAQHAAELRARGVSTSTFGLGADFDEEFLRQLATAGGGQFYFIEEAAQIPDLLTSELGEALDTAARDVVVTIKAPAEATVECVNDFPVERRDSVLEVRLGDSVSGQEVGLAVQVELRGGPAGQIVPVEFLLSARPPDVTPLAGTATWMYADDGAVAGQPRDWPVVRAWAELTAARARLQALALNKRGEYNEAKDLLQRAASFILHERHGDRMVHEIGHRLLEESGGYGVRLSALEAKSRHFGSSSRLRDRMPDGKSRRPSGTTDGSAGPSS